MHKDLNHHRHSIEIKNNWIAGGRSFYIILASLSTVQHYYVYDKLSKVGFYYRTTPKDVPQNIKQIIFSSKLSVLAEKKTIP